MLEVDIAHGIKELEATRADAEKEAEISRIARKQLEASLEVKVGLRWFCEYKSGDLTRFSHGAPTDFPAGVGTTLSMQVRERVKEQKMEIMALNEMVRKAHENEIQLQDKHKTHVENLRSSAKERLDAANKSAEAAEMNRQQLQESVATQLADASRRCHQAEAKTQAVCVFHRAKSSFLYQVALLCKRTRSFGLQLERKLDHQAKAFKMRILTLEASMKDLKQTSEDLRRQVCAKEQELETQAEELDLSLARERLLARDITRANEAVACKTRCVEEVEAQLALARRELSLEQTARKVKLQSRSGCLIRGCELP